MFWGGGGGVEGWLVFMPLIALFRRWLTDQCFGSVIGFRHVFGGSVWALLHNYDSQAFFYDVDLVSVTHETKFYNFFLYWFITRRVVSDTSAFRALRCFIIRFKCYWCLHGYAIMAVTIWSMLCQPSYEMHVQLRVSFSWLMTMHSIVSLSFSHFAALCLN